MTMEVDASNLSTALQPHEATEDAMVIDDMEAPSDPDAQAAITDFLDFTEYLPSDMARSFTLVEELEQKYVETTASIKQLIAEYQELPDKSAAKLQDNSIIKATLSEKLNQTIRIRALAQAEARKTAKNVARHQQKLFQIQAKLDNLYETFPTAQEEAAAASHTISAQATKVPKITLRLGGEPGGHERSRVKRGPRITVPGEVLAPYEFDWDTLDSDPSITADEEPVTNTRPSIGGPKKIRLKIPKSASQEKTARLPRPAGVVGTNVHSAVAGISTTNALAKLQPPPDDAPIGSDHRPWGRLTQFELAKLRKRMKKNAVWQPSTTMINRELTTVARSLAHYKAAKKGAEDTGKPFLYMWNPPESSPLPLSEGLPPVEQAHVETLEEQPIINKGMVLNEQKKAKKESIAATAALEHEESTRKLADAARVIGGLFTPLDPTKASEKNAPESSIAPAPKAPAKAAPRKRKRDSTVETVASQRESSMQPSKPAITPSTPLPQTPAPAAILPSAKRPKIETPVPLPPPGIGSRISMPVTVSRSRAASTANATVGAAASPISASGQAPSQAPAQTSVQPAAPPVTEMSPIPETHTNTTTASSASSTITTTGAVLEANVNIPVPPPSPRKSSTPILPPTRGKRGAKPAILPTPSPASTAAPQPAAPPPTSPALSSLPSLPSAPAPVDAASLVPPAEGISTRSRTSTKTPEPRRSSRTPSVRSEPVPAPVPAPVPTPARAPARAPTPASSVVSVIAGLRPPSRGKASSVDPTPLTAAKERPHRTSTANNTPAPEPAATRTSRGRDRKPAPGQVTNGPSGSTAISVGKRSVAPKTRKGGKKPTKAEMVAAARASAEAGEVEVDEDGNVIPADEARYCICNRVSFGEMIACENPQCKYEWFHLPCVGLTMETLPGRRQKWYCPECRVALGIGEKGTATAKNGKK